MLIRELAERTGVSPRALRHYEDTGLLTPGRSSGGYRLFTEDDVVRVRQIRRMIDAGMGTTQIRRYIDCARNGDHGFQLDMCPDLQAELDELAVRLSEARKAPQSAVQDAYAARAREYTAALGSIDRVAPCDISLISDWALGIRGPVLDVGCGPGQWTRLLVDLGCRAEGVDPVPEFIDIARAAHPGVRFRPGRAEELGVGDNSLGGVLAWYSLIHTGPAGVTEALDEFARSLRKGGRLALGFFTGPMLETFDHAVTTAWYWPVDMLRVKVEAAGFAVTHVESRSEPGSRAHGAITAVLS